MTRVSALGFPWSLLSWEVCCIHSKGTVHHRDLKQENVLPDNIRRFPLLDKANTIFFELREQQNTNPKGDLSYPTRNRIRPVLLGNLNHIQRPQFDADIIYAKDVDDVISTFIAKCWDDHSAKLAIFNCIIDAFNGIDSTHFDNVDEYIVKAC